MNYQLLQDRWEKLEHWHLLPGSHKPNDDGQMCVMEAVAWIYGKDWTDSPACVSPVIATFMRNWNDSLPTDEDRDRLLKPLIQDLVGTKSSEELEERRSYMALDWLIRIFTPKWLDLVPSLKAHAIALRDLEEIADMAGAIAAGGKVAAAWDAARDAARAAAGNAARDAAWDAAWDVAGDAAGNAAWDAARDAARAAAGNAARAAAGNAARDAAWDAAWDVAGDAAGNAAGDAAWVAARAAARVAAWAAARDALKPTTAWLQLSAQDLVRRMCALSKFQPYFARIA